MNTFTYVHKVNTDATVQCRKHISIHYINIVKISWIHIK